MKESYKRIVISGAYGMGNLGDEAICKTILKDLFSSLSSLDLKVTILVFDKNQFSESHPELAGDKRVSIKSPFRLKDLSEIVLSVIDIARCHLFIWGGGGLIRDRVDWLKIYIRPLRIAQVLGKKVAILSIGVDKVSKGEVLTEIMNIKKPAYLSVRDKESKTNILEASEVFKDEDVEVVLDPVFHLENIFEYKPKANRIGINLTFSDTLSLSDSSCDKDHLLRELAQALNFFSENKNIEVICLQTAPLKDALTIEIVKSHLHEGINFKVINPMTPNDFLENASSCQSFIGMRMHSVIMASVIPGLPIMGLVYAKKVENVLSEIDFKNTVTINDSGSRKKIVDFLNRPKESAFDFGPARSKSRENTDKIASLLK